MLSPPAHGQLFQSPAANHPKVKLRHLPHLQLCFLRAFSALNFKLGPSSEPKPSPRQPIGPSLLKPQATLPAAPWRTRAGISAGFTPAQAGMSEMAVKSPSWTLKAMRSTVRVQAMGARGRWFKAGAPRASMRSSVKCSPEMFHSDASATKGFMRNVMCCMSLGGLGRFLHCFLQPSVPEAGSSRPNTPRKPKRPKRLGPRKLLLFA